MIDNEVLFLINVIISGKSVLYNFVEDHPITPVSAVSSPTTTTTTTTTTTSSSHTTGVTTTSGSSNNSKSSSPHSLQFLRAAWKNLTSLGAGSSKLPHLERPDVTSCPVEPHDYRYTHFPNTNSNKRHKETTFHNTHIHLTPATRTYTHPHRSPVPPPPRHHQLQNLHHQQQHIVQSSSEPLSIAKCLKKHREKYHSSGRLPRKCKSDNALQKVGANLKTHSDHNLHKVWLIGDVSCVGPPKYNSIFSNVQLSGGSGDSCRSFDCGSGGSSDGKKSSSDRRRGKKRQQRSRSLERNQGNRIQTNIPVCFHRHTRSLERNHKFRVDLLGSPLASSGDEPPDHPAPPRPITPTHVHWSPPDCLDGSGGSASSSTCGSCKAMDSQGAAGSFINKPPRGWLHQDHQLAEEGIPYNVRVS